jgi:hypothetical protein
MGGVKSAKPYLKFTALEDGTFRHNTDALEYSLDEGKTWVALPANTDTPTIHTGESVCWRGTNTPGNRNKWFISSGMFDASGDPLSICYGNNFVGHLIVSNYTYARLFQGCSNLVNARDIIIRADFNNTQNVCAYMFKDCSSLIYAPALPCTIATQSCYLETFRGCTSLIAPPELPATTLSQSCYMSMFLGCTSLSTVPELSATTLANNCYQGMFNGCTSLTTAPELLANTLVTNCYREMFKGCTKLSYVKALFTDNTATNPLYNWLYGVSSTGTLVKSSGVTIPSGASGIPKNWTVEEV